MDEGNIPRVIKEMAQATHSLDIGGWYRPLRSATHVLDINPFETRLQHAAYDPRLPERHGPETWLQRDICDHTPWPYPDKFFDFAVCSHVLEDIRDPIWVVSEMTRVSKAGYVETPSAVASCSRPPPSLNTSSTGETPLAAVITGGWSRWIPVARRSSFA